MQRLRDITQGRFDQPGATSPTDGTTAVHFMHDDIRPTTPNHFPQNLEQTQVALAFIERGFAVTFKYSKTGEVTYIGACKFHEHPAYVDVGGTLEEARSFIRLYDAEQRDKKRYRQDVADCCGDRPKSLLVGEQPLPGHIIPLPPV